MGDKAEAVMSLLGEQTNTGPKKLIEEVGAPEVDNTSSTEEVEEPSMMEMMMAAQLEAKRANDAAKEKERAKQAKKFGGGFKKGFFGGDSKPTKKKSTTSASATQHGTDSSKKSSIPPIPSPSSSNSDIPTIAKKETANSLVMDDVQEAMKEDNPLLNKIKEGEWATPDLMGTLQDNPILASGLRNPKCMAALQLLQSDPTEAKKRFEKDADVSLFLQEFGRVMSGHFNRLGEQQTPQSTALPTQTTGNAPVQEIGPLHAEALNREKQMKAAGNTSAVSVSTTSPEEEARVKEICQDDELRALLMDVQLQEILRECNDPRKFQMHMQNPVTAGKIKKLYAAGLVGTAK